MEKNDIVEFLYSKPDVMLEIIGEILTRYHDVIDKQGNTEAKKQLYEISKTIDRLESLDIPIPDELRGLKSSLLAESHDVDQAQNLIVTLISGLNDLCRDYRKNVKPQPKSRRNVNVIQAAKPTDSEDPEKYFNVNMHTVHTNRLKDYRFTKPRYVKITDNDPIELRTWRQLKKYVYDFIIKSNPSLSLTGILEYSIDPKQYRAPIALQNGYYIEGNVGASEIVAQCLRAMEAASFNTNNDIVIGYTFTGKRKYV